MSRGFSSESSLSDVAWWPPIHQLVNLTAESIAGPKWNRCGNHFLSFTSTSNFGIENVCGTGCMAMLAPPGGVVTSAPTHHSHQAPPCTSIINILAKYALHKIEIIFVHQNVVLVRE